MSMWCGMLGWRVWLPGLMGTMSSSSQAGCSTLAMYRHSPLYAADHSGSATGTACAAHLLSAYMAHTSVTSQRGSAGAQPVSCSHVLMLSDQGTSWTSLPGRVLQLICAGVSFKCSRRGNLYEQAHASILGTVLSVGRRIVCLKVPAGVMPWLQASLRRSPGPCQSPDLAARSGLRARRSPPP